MNENISFMIQKLTATSSKTSNHEGQLTEISSKLSNYEYRLTKLRTKDTQIQQLSLHTTKLVDTSSNTDNHEEQLTEITSKFSAYETRLEKLSISNINKIDTAMKEHEEIMKKLTKILMTSKMSHLAPSIRNSLLQIHTNIIFLPTNLQMISLNDHFSSHRVFIYMLPSLPNTYHP